MEGHRRRQLILAGKNSIPGWLQVSEANSASVPSLPAHLLEGGGMRGAEERAFPGLMGECARSGGAGDL